ncbi:MAG: HlyD family secretion protein [Lysobacterales bacterium]
MTNLYRSAALDARRQQMFGEVLLTSPRFGRYVLLAGAVLLSALMLLVMLGNYRARETVSGFLTSEQGMLQVRAGKAGRVAQRLVNEGDPVIAGQVLYQLVVESWTDQQRLEDARLHAAETQVQQAVAAIERHHTRRQLETGHREQAKESAQLRLNFLDAQLRDASNHRRLARERFAVAQRARERQLISLIDFQRSEINQVEAVMAYRETLLRRDQQRQALTDLKHQNQLLPIEAGQELARLSQQLSDARSRQAATRYDNRFDVRAPASGRVNGLAVNAGQWVAPGQVMATVQGPAPLVARLLVPTRAAGRVVPGQSTRIKLAAFPYQKHGVLDARVSVVSLALVHPGELPSGLSLREPAYWVTARFDHDENLTALAMQPGMVLSADLLREERRIWQWLAQPLLSLRS